MLSKVLSLGLSGVYGYEVQTECYIGTGLPAFDLVGLPDASVKEARERVRAAIKNCGFRFPVSRIIVNLALFWLPPSRQSFRRNAARSSVS